MAEIRANDVRVRIATNLTTPVFKDIICREDTTVSISTPVNVRKTVCGPKVSVGEPEVTINGGGVADTVPTAEQISHKDLLAIQIAKQPVLLEISGGSGGADLYIKVTAYFTDLDIELPVDDSVNFTFNLQNSGAVDITP